MSYLNLSADMDFPAAGLEFSLVLKKKKKQWQKTFWQILSIIMPYITPHFEFVCTCPSIYLDFFET